MLRAILCLFAAACFLPAGAAEPVLVVVEKVGSHVGFYSAEGQLLGKAPTGDTPHEMVFSKDGQFVYTTDNGSLLLETPGAGGNTVSVVNVRRRKSAGSISLGDFRRPHGIDLDPKSGLLAVSTELPDRLVLIDPAARKVVKSYPTGGKTAHIVTFGPGGTYAYVSNSGSGTVAAIRVSDGQTKLIQTGVRPEGSILSPDGKLLYVADRTAGTVSMIDTGKNEKVGEVRTGEGPVRVGVTPDGKTLAYGMYAGEGAGFIDTASRKVLGEIKLTGQIVSMTMSRDGRLAYCSAQDLDRVYVLDVATRKLVRTLQLAPKSGPDPVMEAPR